MSGYRETIRILDPAEWPLVAPLVRGLFRNSMPETPAQGSFLAALDGYCLVGFVHVEQLFHFNCVYVAPPRRGTDLALRLMSDAASRVPAGHSAFLLSDRPAIGRLAEALGASDRGTWRYWRKDF